MVVWAGVKYVPLDILRGDGGYFWTTDSEKPEKRGGASWRLRVMQNDLRIYEFRLQTNPKILCTGVYGDSGPWGHCVYDPDYKPEPILVPETLPEETQ